MVHSSTMLVALLCAAPMTLGCGHSEAVRQPGEPVEVVREVGASGIPVAMAPSALLRPGAERALQQALVTRGLLRPAQATAKLDDRTRAALKAFQEREDLPATGLPSYTTVRRLGLRVDHIFEKKG